MELKVEKLSKISLQELRKEFMNLSAEFRHCQPQNDEIEAEGKILSIYGQKVRVELFGSRGRTLVSKRELEECFKNNGFGAHLKPDIFVRVLDYSCCHGIGAASEPSEYRERINMVRFDPVEE